MDRLEADLKERERPRNQEHSLRGYPVAGQSSFLIVVSEIETRQDRRAFFLDGIEVVRIKTQELKNCGRHLSGFHKTVEGPMFELGIRYKQHHVSIVPCEAAVLGLLFRASRVNHAHVRQDDDIGGAGIAAFPQEAARTWFVRHTGTIKDRIEGRAIKDLAEPYGCSVGISSIPTALRVLAESVSHSWEMSSSASPRPVVAESGRRVQSDRGWRHPVCAGMSRDGEKAVGVDW